MAGPNILETLKQTLGKRRCILVRSRGSRFGRRTFIIVFWAYLSVGNSGWTQMPPAQLSLETLQAFQRYVDNLEAMHDQRRNGDKPFLWIQDSPKNRLLVEQGEILIHQNVRHSVDIPGGIIHDWIGAMFVPGASLEKTLQMLQDYNRHQKIFPEVVESKVISKEDNRIRSYLRLVKEKVLKVVLNTEHEVQFRRVTDKRWSICSRSTRINEVKDAGKPSETELPEGEGSGFLWRFNAYWRLEEVEKGLYLELVTVSLSREMPSGLAWLLEPFIQEVPKESLQSTLEATRLAIKP